MYSVAYIRHTAYMIMLVLFLTFVVQQTHAHSHYKAVQTLTPWIPGTPTYGTSYGLDMRINGDYLFVNDKTSMPLGIPFCSVVYVYKRINGEWVNSQVISTEGVFDLDGDVSIEAQGPWLMFSAVGTPLGEIKTDPNFQGSVQIYKLNTLSGQYEFFQSLDGSTPGLENLSTLGIVGFPFDLSPESLAVQAGAGFGFGLSLDAANGRLLVSAQFQPTPSSSAINPGAAYAFELGNDGYWYLTQTFYSPDGPSDYDRFGGAVMIKDNYAFISNGTVFPIPKVNVIVGNSNSAVYVYRFNENTNMWEYTGQKLTGNQKTLPVLPGTTIPVGDQFGSAIAMYKKWLFVAAPFESVDPVLASLTGAVYVYKLEKKNGVKRYVKKQKIESSDRRTLAFGVSRINTSKGRAVISDSCRRGPGGVPYQGGVLVLKLECDKWEKEETLFDPDGFVNNFFGVGAEIQGDTVVGGTYTLLATGFEAFAAIPVGPPFHIPYFITLPPAPGKVVIFEKSE